MDIEVLGMSQKNIMKPNNSWDKTKSKPDTDRFVLLTLEDGEEREAQYKEAPTNPFRSGKDWINKRGKYAAVKFNPPISWKEIQPLASLQIHF